MDNTESFVPGFHGRGIELIMITAILNGVALLVVLLRFWMRVKPVMNIGRDDVAILGALVFSTLLSLCNFVGVYFGYGKMSRDLSTRDLDHALKTFYMNQIMYKVSLCLVKLSILLLYVRIFPGRLWKRHCCAAGIVVLGYSSAGIIATIVQCIPIARIWDKSITGHCIDMTRFWYCIAALNMFTDLWILGMPLRKIQKLFIPNRQKYGLYVVFLLGLFVWGTSIPRMVSLKKAAKTVDPTYGTMWSTIWTTIEVNTAIIFACLPMLKRPASNVFSQLSKLFAPIPNPLSPISKVFRRFFRVKKTRSPAGSTPFNSTSRSSVLGHGRFGKLQASIHLRSLGQGTGQATSQEAIFSSDHTGDVPEGSISKTTKVEIRSEIRSEEVENMNSFSSGGIPPVYAGRHGRSTFGPGHGSSV